MAYRSAVISYLDGLLQPERYERDPSANGLQIEGGEMVNKVIFGVDASQALFDAAVEHEADMIVVHHGLFWKGMPYPITGLAAQRIRTLFVNDISLYAMHLPLDANPEFGHNAMLAQMIGLTDRQPFCTYAGYEIGVAGHLPPAVTAVKIVEMLEHELNTQARIYGDPDKTCGRTGIVSGGCGLDGLFQAMAASLDCLIIGEFEHTMWHVVKESGLTVIALGHYASEQAGLKALLAKLRDDMDISCAFIDIPTGL